MMSTIRRRKRSTVSAHPPNVCLYFYVGLPHSVPSTVPHGLSSPVGCPGLGITLIIPKNTQRHITPSVVLLLLV